MKINNKREMFNMFKKKTKKQVEITELDKAIKRAIEIEDWALLEMLQTVEKEHDKKVFKAQLKGIASGAVLTHVGALIGEGIVKLIETKTNK
jgi:hypothetical protein